MHEGAPSPKKFPWRRPSTNHRAGVTPINKSHDCPGSPSLAGLARVESFHLGLPLTRKGWATYRSPPLYTMVAPYPHHYHGLRIRSEGLEKLERRKA